MGSLARHEPRPKMVPKWSQMVPKCSLLWGTRAEDGTSFQTLMLAMESCAFMTKWLSRGMGASWEPPRFPLKGSFKGNTKAILGHYGCVHKLEDPSNEVSGSPLKGGSGSRRVDRRQVSS